MRVGLDTNVIISAFISVRGAPAKVISSWNEDGLFDLIMSKEIFAEVGAALRYSKITKLHQLNEGEIATALKSIKHQSLWVRPNQHFTVLPDESDNKFIECAIEANADFLVTGDTKHLLPIEAYKGIPIISPPAFLAVLKLENKKELV